MPQLGWTARADGFIDFYNRGWYDYTGTTYATMQGWGWKTVPRPLHARERHRPLAELADHADAV